MGIEMSTDETSADRTFDQVTDTKLRKHLCREEKRGGSVDTERNGICDGGPGRPTVQRTRHDPVYEATDLPPNEDASDYRPMRVKDRWQRMEEAGTIDQPMRRAVYRFRRNFLFAGFETLRAGPLLRLARSTRASDPSEHRLDARRAVWAALDALGGASAPSGSVIWHCVGRDETVKDWAVRQNWAGRAPLNETAAKGILLAALWTLAEHYRRVEKLERDRRERREQNASAL